MHVTKRNGTKQPYDSAKALATLTRACRGLDEIDPSEILNEAELVIYDGVTTRELHEALMNAATQNIQRDPAYGTLAARLLLGEAYRMALGKDELKDPPAATRAKFPALVRAATERGLLDANVVARFDLDRLASALDASRDELFDYIGLFTLVDRYLLRDHSAGRVLETPQTFWMRIAMGVSWKEDDPNARALEFYAKMSRLEYVPSTPTLFNACTPYSQLSSCFLMETQDSIADIGDGLKDIMLLAKYAGGIGTSVTRLRATGSHIRTINGKSSGPIPFIKMMDAVISGVDQGGRRRGTLAVYMEPWHYDIEKYLALKQRAGDEHLRAHTLNTVLWLNDEFLRRVQRNDEWHLFDPNETQDLPDLYGEAFASRYREYEERARRGEMRLVRRVRARDLFEKMLKNLQETSHPWITFKDAGNIRSPIKNVGVVHSSNLCTEIFLPTDKDNVAVCNLTSVNLARHLTPESEVDWDLLAESVRIAIRQLDNVIDANYYAIPEAEHANKASRPIGLGVMGLSDLLEAKGIAYDSAEAFDLFDRIIERMSFEAIRASHALALERGSFPRFEGSDWSQGILPIDTIDHLEKERGAAIAVDRTRRLPWDALRADVRRGMRNGTLMAIAPTATIGLIAGASPSIEPNFSNIFSRNNLGGKFLEVNHNLVAKLKHLGLWGRLSDEILRRRGDIQGVRQIPEDVRRVYRTAYDLGGPAQVEMAARAQKWVDMGISRNMYLNTKDLASITETYLGAWRKGLKSTYYAFFKTAMFAEASYSGNETKRRAEWTPTATEQRAAPQPANPPGEACALDDPNCEACQ